MKSCYLRPSLGSSAGLGHFMRCFYLADELTRNSFVCTFFLDLLPSIIPYENEAISYIVLEDCEIKDLICNKAFQPPDIYIVDSYIESVRNTFNSDDFSRSCKVLFDDINLISPRSVDLFINPSIGHVNIHTYDRLIGSDFIPISPELKKNVKRTFESAKPSICLISIGATDPHNYTCDILNALSSISEASLFSYIVVLSSLAPGLASVKESIDSCTSLSIKLVIDPNDIVDLYIQSDFCIGAAGSSSWERSLIGLPTAQFSVASNQDLIQSFLSSREAIFPLPLPSNNCFKFRLKLFLAEVSLMSSTIKRLSENSQLIVDGLGCSRIVDQLKLHLPS